MSYLNDLVKIKYIDLGYLPNYPYHMITDKEMIDAFMGDGQFFDTFYPCPDSSLSDAYQALRDNIQQVLTDYLEDNINTIPDWIYSYMFGNTTTYQSDERDIDYLYELANMTPSDGYGIFTKELAQMCYETSQAWLVKQVGKSYDRVPTMFGEPHVIKSLRLLAADILSDIP